MLHKMLSALRYLVRREKVEHELDAELKDHIERQAAENLRRGMSPEDAWASAQRELGPLQPVKEECREVRTGRLIEATLQDVRYGLRILVRNPGFTMMAVLTLALGIGVNTAIFSVVYGVLLRPLPYQRGGQLVVLHQQATAAKVRNIPFSAKEIFDYRDLSHTLDAVVEHHSMVFLLISPDHAERVQTAVVSANFFDVLGVKPLLGRTFIANDEDPKSGAVLVMSHKYWQTRHGADPNIVGKVFQMNNRAHTVIGVLPSIPQYPGESDVYMPTSQCPTRSSQGFIANRQARMMTAFGRLKPGVPLEKAQADLSTVASQLEKSYPDAYPKGAQYGIAAALLQDDLTRRARTTFLVLLGAAGLVLLIACANVANLFLARLLKLERELAVRTALGASKARLIRQLMTESMLLAIVGGALGLALAPPTVRLLVQFAERFTTRASEVRVDGPVLLFTLAVSLFTGLLFGLAPAFSTSGQTSDALKQGMGRSTASRGRQRLRSALVLAQVAVSFMLLIGAGLMIRSFQRLQETNPGVATDRLLTMRLSVAFNRHSQPEFFAAFRKILQAVRATPGVELAALASNFPFSRNGIVSGPGTVEFQIEGQPVAKAQLSPIVDTTYVTEGYFEALRQPLVAGRLFTAHDDEKSLPVAVVNQSMAKHRWPAGDAVGRRVSFDHGASWVTIQGVVADSREYGLEHPAGDEVYMPVLQGGFGGNLVVRTLSADPIQVASLVRGALREVDPFIAVDQIETLDRLRDESMASPRVTAMLLGLFAALALVVSASGIAAVMALSVTQRTNELGIRMALGASRNAVLGMVVGQGMILAATGVAIGIAGALGLTRLLKALLYATSPTDLWTFVAVSAIFLSVAAAATLIPARQVTAIDPLIALRQE